MVLEVLSREFFIVGEHFSGGHEGEIANDVPVQSLDGTAFFVDGNVYDVVFVELQFSTLESKPVHLDCFFVALFESCADDSPVDVARSLPELGVV